MVGWYDDGKASRDSANFEAATHNTEHVPGVRVKHAPTAVARIDRQLHEVM